MKPLKPCPFCGARSPVISQRGSPREGAPDGPASFVVMCMGCGINTPEYETDTAAVRYWNTRKRAKAVTE